MELHDHARSLAAGSLGSSELFAGVDVESTLFASSKSMLDTSFASSEGGGSVSTLEAEAAPLPVPTGVAALDRAANACYDVAYHPNFADFVMGCIVAAGVLVGVQTYPALERDPIVAGVDNAILGVFALE